MTKTIQRTTTIVKRANPMDKYVGTRMRMRREMLGMSQGKLGKMLGLSFQQIQKYENGTNRIGAGRLQKIAQIFDVPVSFFFEGAPSDNILVSEDALEVLSAVQGLSLLKAFMRVKDEETRRHIVGLVNRIADRNSQ
jgi:transcriptional regulator with XRE-family HTH domain